MNALFSYWHFDPGIIFFTIGICLFYLFTVRFNLPSKAYYFLGALLLIILCEASPLHFLGENYLFSAHMLSHILIILLAGPLIVASLPVENRFQKQLVFFSYKIAKAPILTWLCGVAIMWFWHIPSIFNGMFMMNGSASGLMFLHFLSLIIAGMLFSWPIINPYKSSRLKPLASVIYLSTACVFCSLLGLIITFSHIGTYTPYLNITDRFGFLPLIRNKWNISVSADQQMAGLIMWVPGCFIYLSASMVLLIKWFSGKEESATIEGLVKV
ncbi:MAG: cytochrome c oxidase assembly protein [Ginsengibacter sp.]|nr:cytochrome c oxidase assembly protein [Hanamia sp.]